MRWRLSGAPHATTPCTAAETPWRPAAGRRAFAQNTQGPQRPAPSQPSSPSSLCERTSSLVQLLLHLRQLQKIFGQLLLVIVRVHCRFLIFENVDLLLELFFLREQVALCRIVGSGLRASQTNQREIRNQEALARRRRRLANSFLFAGILKHRMLSRETLLRVVEVSRLLRGIDKSFHRANGLVLVRIRGGVLQRLGPVTRKDCRVLFRA